MNKGNVHTRISGWWYDDRQGQREKENRYYTALEDPIRHKKKVPERTPVAVTTSTCMRMWRLS